VPSELLAAREAPRLAEMRRQTLEARIDAGLHLGRHASAWQQALAIAEELQLPAAEELRAKLRPGVYPGATTPADAPGRGQPENVSQSR
jgi:hypothetical protein